MPRVRECETEVHATWQTGAKKELIAHAMRALQGNERILIITPWKHRAAEFAAALDIPQFTSDLNAGDTYRAWTDFASGDTPGLGHHTGHPARREIKAAHRAMFPDHHAILNRQIGKQRHRHPWLRPRLRCGPETTRPACL